MVLEESQLYRDLMRLKPQGWTANAWAVRAGVSRTVWTDMRRHGNPSRRTLEKLLTAAGSSLAEFEAPRVGDAFQRPEPVKNLAESPLGWLFSRGLLTSAQFDAGERLRADWERAQLGPRVTMTWDSVPIARSRGRAAPDRVASDSQIDAKRRFDAALAEAGPGLSDILWRIVCAGEGMRDAESALGWPARAGRLVLTLALDRVARFYRIG